MFRLLGRNVPLSAGTWHFARPYATFLVPRAALISRARHPQAAGSAITMIGLPPAGRKRSMAARL